MEGYGKERKGKEGMWLDDCAVVKKSRRRREKVLTSTAHVARKTVNNKLAGCLLPAFIRRRLCGNCHSDDHAEEMRAT